jgi:hypothetical protein
MYIIPQENETHGMNESAPDWFDTEFWPRYPRKEKKIAARDAMRWAMQNHNQDGKLRARIVAALTWGIEVRPEWNFWTTPDKWILGQRWTDEPPMSKAKPLTEFERQREASHQRAIAQQIEYARKRQEAS